LYRVLDAVGSVSVDTPYLDAAMEAAAANDDPEPAPEEDAEMEAGPGGDEPMDKSFSAMD